MTSASNDFRSVVSNRLCIFQRFCKANRSFLVLLLVYSGVLVVLYCAQTVTTTALPAWGLYPYFDYVSRVQVTPFIDFRSGYPPLGVFTYYPLFLIAQSEVGFQLYLGLMNIVALALSVLLIYLTSRSVFGKGEATRTAILLMVLPAMAILSYAAVEPLSLLFMTAAVYCIVVRKNATLSGLFIGLGFMTKIYPILLLIPAFGFFRSRGGVSRLLYSAFFSAVIISLPFLTLDPFMYSTVFLHHGIRGPSNTIWALLEGFYGHTGLLHPDFDQFLYFWQLVNVYKPRLNDHAFYLWTIPSLPSVLVFGQVASMVGCFFLSHKQSDEIAVLKISAITILSFLFFSKLYSPQFGVFLLPFVILAFDKFRYRVVFGVSLDAMHEVQGLIWSRNFYDYHFLLFVSEIIARSAAFLISIALLTYQLRRRSNVGE